GFTVFVLSGGLFVLTQGGQGLLNVASGYSFVYPGDINNQTTQEAVFTTLIYAMGILGLYMMFMSTRYAYRPKRAYEYLALGLIMRRFFIVRQWDLKNGMLAKKRALPRRLGSWIQSYSNR